MAFQHFLAPILSETTESPEFWVPSLMWCGEGRYTWPEHLRKNRKTIISTIQSKDTEGYAKQTRALEIDQDVK